MLLRYLVNERRYPDGHISRAALFMIAVVKRAACTIDSSRRFGWRKWIAKASRRKIDLGLMTHVYIRATFARACSRSAMPLHFLIDKVLQNFKNFNNMRVYLIHLQDVTVWICYFFKIKNINKLGFLLFCSAYIKHIVMCRPRSYFYFFIYCS